MMKASSYLSRNFDNELFHNFDAELTRKYNIKSFNYEFDQLGHHETLNCKNIKQAVSNFPRENLSRFENHNLRYENLTFSQY